MDKNNKNFVCTFKIYDLNYELNNLIKKLKTIKIFTKLKAGIKV